MHRLTAVGENMHTCMLSHRRKIYDQTGETDEDLMDEKFTESYEYFRAMFKKVTEEDLDDFFVSSNV